MTVDEPDEMAEQHEPDTVARRGRWRTGERSRRRILDAARALFAERGYDRATVRRIAATAQVDPAMVYYFFETKSRLFTEALALPVNPAEEVAAELSGGVDGLGERIVRHFLDVWDRAPTVEPMLALLRSAPTDERSAAMFTGYIEQEIIARIATVVPEPARLRAELVGSHLMGLLLARHVLRIEPLASTSPDTVATWMGPTLQRYLTDPAPAPDPTA
ncbi:transcriptional regulator, TetR family [Pseudonocardia ammonioxydans]|uniref:Transcriptional regulator, TetR family n=1 Tax=Pseudonocardia ammonioxydans TaxID=260086 RepID=A0A1I5AZ01_PSUAM|nr:TetR family transcriptional regulator [Pseudonocardia ammonioxydans]SFN67685.1 transcriptional regulator, TetR family [Pseudonocardia ammonioxydans]